MDVLRRTARLMPGHSCPAAFQTPSHPPPSSPPSPPYEYAALEAGHIRLLTLFPATHESDPLRCTLRQVSGADLLYQYAALSYTWGPDPGAAAMETLMVVDAATPHGHGNADGEVTVRVLPIRPSLKQALTSLRDTMPAQGLGLTLWIDALCINQADLPEKSEQISHMHFIYTAAARVIIWLGPSAGDSDFIIDAISDRFADDDEYRSRRFILGMLAVLRRPWFSRTWITQELVLNARPPLIACGRRRLVTWDQLDETIGKVFPVTATTTVDQLPQAYWDTVAPFLSLIYDSTVSYIMLRSVRSAMHRKHSGSGPTTINLQFLWSAIRATRHLHATDPRDKVYGILALTGPLTHEDLPVDYHKPVEQVFRDAALYMLRRERTVAMYAFLPLSGERLREPMKAAETLLLPSWVPDFSAPEVLSADGPIVGDPFRQPNDVPILLADTFRLPQHDADSVELSACGRHLLTKAMFLDYIEEAHTTPPFRRQPIPLWAYPQVLTVLAMSWVQTLLGYIPGSSFLPSSSASSDWVSPTLLSSHLALLMSMVEISKSMVEMERLAGSRVLRWGHAGAVEPFWQTLFLAMIQQEEDELYGGHTMQSLQVKFNGLMMFVRGIAEVEGRVPWYSKWVRYGRVQSLFTEVESMTMPVSQRIFNALRQQRTFIAGLGLWYGFAQGDVREGDRLALLFPGANIPFVLREQKAEDGGGSTYTMVGMARVPEQLRRTAVQDLKENWVDIVIQ